MYALDLCDGCDIGRNMFIDIQYCCRKWVAYYSVFLKALKYYCTNNHFQKIKIKINITNNFPQLSKAIATSNNINMEKWQYLPISPFYFKY